MHKSLSSSPTKLKLLDATQNLMLTKGFTATSLDEICNAAAVTKGSFFHYFASKEELGKAVLTHYMAAHFQALQAAPFRKKRDPLERVYGHIDYIILMSRDSAALRGCLLGNFAQDLCGSHPAIGEQCAHHFDQWAEALKCDLDAAKLKHAPDATFSTQSLAEHFIVIIEGALILVKAKQDGKILGQQLRHFKRYLQSLFAGKA